MSGDQSIGRLLPALALTAGLLAGCGGSGQTSSAATPARTPLPTTGSPPASTGRPLLDQLLSAAMPTGDDVGLDRQLRPSLPPLTDPRRAPRLVSTPELEQQGELAPIDPCDPLSATTLAVPHTWDATRSGRVVVETAQWTHTWVSSAWHYPDATAALAALATVQARTGACANQPVVPAGALVSDLHFTDDGPYTVFGHRFSWSLLDQSAPRTAQYVYFVEDSTLLRLGVILVTKPFLKPDPDAAAPAPNDVEAFLGAVRGRTNRLSTELAAEQAGSQPA